MTQPDPDLRDRIAAALYERERPPRDPQWSAACTMDRETFEEMADAVLAVLPEPADRATVLNAAAQHLYTALFPAVYDDMGQKAAEGVQRAVSELRRLAGETPADTEAPCPDPIECSHEAALGEAEAEAERQLAAVQRVRRVLEVEPVLNRSALEYRGLILDALTGTQPAAGARQDGAQQS
ncbi:hypothetical protein GCM10018980_51430 [Streptomyces capoamus]|uniref:Uncharacterized protein n=1 Tax=Streptomyces capoamus TaxID=68183 RepID=A0A919KDE7_9ACTN|nr:hypothetical protein [Streptomyces capoamus]GGW15813.1 hypothetical protein GCM10010501_29380 [Streptomyces libani subsp. rufus]GHG61910.1 hypothetical protein GCM10018980_51430 [Streptomyces capoamus]